VNPTLQNVRYTTTPFTTRYKGGGSQAIQNSYGNSNLTPHPPLPLTLTLTLNQSKPDLRITQATYSKAEEDVPVVVTTALRNSNRSAKIRSKYRGVDRQTVTLWGTPQSFCHRAPQLTGMTWPDFIVPNYKVNLALLTSLVLIILNNISATFLTLILTVALILAFVCCSCQTQFSLSVDPPVV